MSTVKNGQYLVLVDNQVIQFLGCGHEGALEYLMTYYKLNSKKRPDAYLVQVVASLEYPPPEIKTLAHEKMV